MAFKGKDECGLSPEAIQSWALVGRQKPYPLWVVRSPSFSLFPLAAANPKGVLIDNPQASRQWLSYQKFKDAWQHSHNVSAALVAQTQDDQSWILVGRVRSDVGEAHI